jgi:hypothetical protein
MYRDTANVEYEMKCVIMQVVVTGATGIVTKGLKKNSKEIPGKSSVDSLKKDSCT